MTDQTSPVETAPKFPRLTASSCKLDELGYFEKLQKAIKGSYLESLLSDQLREWFAAQIHNDFCPDIFGAFKSEQAANNDLTAQVEDLKSKIDTFIKTITEKDQTIENCRKFNAQHIATIESLEKRLFDTDQALYQATTAADCEQQDFERQITAYKQQVIELKAKLYDLEHKND